MLVEWLQHAKNNKGMHELTANSPYQETSMSRLCAEECSRLLDPPADTCRLRLLLWPHEHLLGMDVGRTVTDLRNGAGSSYGPLSKHFQRCCVTSPRPDAEKMQK